MTDGDRRACTVCRRNDRSYEFVLLATSTWHQSRASYTRRRHPWHFRWRDRCDVIDDAPPVVVLSSNDGSSSAMSYARRPRESNSFDIKYIPRLVVASFYDYHVRQHLSTVNVWRTAITPRGSYCPYSDIENAPLSCNSAAVFQCSTISEQHHLATCSSQLFHRQRPMRNVDNNCYYWLSWRNVL